MTATCLKCGGPAEVRFRPVMGQGRMERLCPHCSDTLSALVQLAGNSCVLAVADPHFAAWLDTGRWPTRAGDTVGPDDLPDGWHSNSCPLCAAFMEEE